MLNGLGIPERIQALCPGRTIWGGCVYIGSRLIAPGSTTSMHTDFKHGKPTELESLTGYVICLGEQSGIATPTYRRMYEKLRALH